MKFFIFIVILLNATAVYPETLYRYQDESGRWYFTDQKPQNKSDIDEVNITATNIVAAESQDINVQIPENLCPPDLTRRSSSTSSSKGYMGKQGGFDIRKNDVEYVRTVSVTNDFFAPVWFRASFTKIQNVSSSPALPLETLIKPNESRSVFTIKPNKKYGWSYNYEHDWQLGDPKAKHDPDCYYLPPVPPGAGYLITQGFNGSFSHNSPYNKYAIDIAMDNGTPVLAVRDGIVVGKETDFTLNGTSQKFLSRANSVYILHGDGTFSIYAHLQFKTITVYEGEKVRAGQIIARSGNTGFSTGPHLHFEVISNVNQNWYSQPFKFWDVASNAPVTPVEGMLLSNISSQ